MKRWGQEAPASKCQVRYPPDPFLEHSMSMHGLVASWWLFSHRDSGACWFPSCGGITLSHAEPTTLSVSGEGDEREADQKWCGAQPRSMAQRVLAVPMAEPSSQPCVCRGSPAPHTPAMGPAPAAMAESLSSADRAQVSRAATPIMVDRKRNRKSRRDQDKTELPSMPLSSGSHFLHPPTPMTTSYYKSNKGSIH